MCQKNNFYGADKKVEIFLDKEIEHKAAVIITNILKTRRFPENFEDYVHLISFLLVSEARNLKSGNASNQLLDYMAKTTLLGNPKFEGIDLDSFTVGYKAPANQGIQVALDCVPLVIDLTPILIVEQTGARKFITSDNPLIRYNSFYLTNNYPSGFGYMTRGLQMFFPISHDKCILLYDKYVYRIPAARDDVLVLNRARDIDQLNELFYLNAYNNVFFNQKTKGRYIEGILYKNKQAPNKNKKLPKITELDRELEKLNIFKKVYSNDEMIYLSGNRVSKKIDFSWLKYTERSKQLIFPSHLGGIHRGDSPFIRDELETKKIRDSKPYDRGSTNHLSHFPR